MRRRLICIQHSQREMCLPLEQFYRKNEGRSVFPRPMDQLLGASAREGLVDAQLGGQIVGVAGVFDTSDRIHEIGGVIVTLNGFRLQRVLMAILAVMVPIANEDFDQVTAAVFDDNFQSIKNLHSQFDIWRNAPESLLTEKAKKANGRGFRLYHAPRYRLVQMAQELLLLAKEPVLSNAEGEEIELVLDHPLFQFYLPAVQAFIAYEMQRLAEEGASLP